MPEDFYDLLGVDADADRERIKRAHREQVREYHPDHNDDERADDQFKAVQRAYEVLSDADKRAAYDRLGHEEYVRERLGGDPTVRRATNMDTGPDASGGTAAGASTGAAADADGGTTDTGGVGGATTSADEGTASQGAGGGTASRGTAGRTPTDVEMGYRAWRRKRRRHHRAAVVGAIAGALLAAAGAVPFLSAHPELVEAAGSPVATALRSPVPAPASVVPSGREWLLPGGTAALAAALSVEARLHGGAAWLLPLLSLGPAAVAGAAMAGTAVPTGAALAGVVAPAPAVAGWLVTRPWRTP